jgi:hypothetical protein
MSDMDEPTAWEEINPRMALAPQREQRARSLGNLAPATSEQFGNELTACLALVVPVGMTEEGRAEWLAVAWATLKHLPPDILAIGCKKARETCDHPSKIVPMIVDETKDLMRWRREHYTPSDLQITGPRPPRHLLDRRGEPMSEDETNELNRLLENLGATARYRPDGSRYFSEAG